MLVFSLDAFAGGGWVKSDGYGYYKLGQAWVSDLGYFSGDGDFASGLETTLLTTSLYAEHGVGKGVSLEGYLPIFVRHSVDGIITEEMEDVQFSDAVNGIGDANLGLRVQLMKKDFFAWSGTFTLGLPLGSPTLGERKNLFTGDGEFNQLIRTDVSAPFGGDKVGGYVTAYTAVNLRAKNFSNEWWYGFEVGVSALESKA